MKQLTVISGKGGTGKTSITAAFASLAKNAVFVDCDVDAADLHLIFKPEIKKTMTFHGLKIADIDKDKCIDCKKCFESCKFDAITKDITRIKQSCEGCGVCAYVCPAKVIKMIDRDSGFAYISDTRFGPMAHAALNTAEEASGKLVTVVRENAKKLAEEKKKDLIIIDGPPGIGCPVIASLTGVDLVLVVTEPTLSGIHDLERILDVASHFNIPAIICINKYDVNINNTKKIERFCNGKNIEVVGKLSYDTIITKAMINQKNIIEFSDGRLSHEIRKMWNKIQEMIIKNMNDNDFTTIVKQIQKKIEDKEEKTYSKIVINEYRNPTNFGVIKNSDAIGIIKGPCGDTIKITLKINNEIIQQAKFWTDGCAATLACGNMITKIIKGKTTNQALNYTMHDIITNLDGLPKNHTHCAKLAINSLHNALDTYNKKKTQFK